MLQNILKFFSGNPERRDFNRKVTAIHAAIGQGDILMVTQLMQEIKSSPYMNTGIADALSQRAISAKKPHIFAVLAKMREEVKI
ncbi:MAG: hypothetical protein EPN97_15650 [Alphaproteobacteria bacterium]|nr:MAG: hypothetical protein EPN97_15650 [Alphaproteobacteria bacterium]